MVGNEPHSGDVTLDNEFIDVWNALKCFKKGVRLKTSKKKTEFIAKAILANPRSSGLTEKAIVFLRDNLGKFRPTCFGCCWRCYYNCNAERIGMYCKALDAWASSSSFKE